MMAGRPYRQDLGNPAPLQDFAQTLREFHERGGVFRNIEDEYERLIKFIQEVKDDVQRVFDSRWRNYDIDDVNNNIHLVTLFRMIPVFNVIVNSSIGHAFHLPDEDSYNRYELKARRFLKDFIYVRAFYNAIYENEIEDCFFNVDADFAKGWYYHVYPKDIECFSWLKWSWADEEWIKRDDEGGEG